jgi:hypothetical protein
MPNRFEKAVEPEEDAIGRVVRRFGPMGSAIQLLDIRVVNLSAETGENDFFGK